MTQLACPKLSLFDKVVNQQTLIETWLREQWQLTPPPLYSSVDLRNAGYKIAPVDTNLFPAGFNNLNNDHMPLVVQAMQSTVAELYSDIKRLLLIPESHSRNTFYFENLAVLAEIILLAGYEVRVGSLDPELTEPRQLELPSGRKLLLEPLLRHNDKVGVADFFPCCIVLNNDLSDGVPPQLVGISQKILPSIKLGWTTRLKSEHFRFYDKVAGEFAELIGIDPWLINPFFDYCHDVDFLKNQGRTCLVKRANILMQRISQKYQQYGVEEEPFLAIKADQGTYGMAVMMVQHAEQLAELNRKQRTRMSTAKGGKMVDKAILQEGVYTMETAGSNQSVAEPVLYMIGRHVVGGFYRVHEKRGMNENLNAPGMNFQPLPFMQACNLPCAEPDSMQCRYYIYGVVARLAALAAARELDFLSKE